MKRAERTDVEQLDILRGVAIVMMVTNHAGFALLSPTLQHNPITASAIFIGSFAPVVFFFTTGFGIGIVRAEVSMRDFRPTLLKAFLLVVADQFFFWRNGMPYGLDFLSFIAIATVVTTAVTAFARPVLLSGLLVISFIAIRFALGPLLRQHWAPQPIVDWLVGIRGVDGVSYPLSPWIIYPLLGFIMARRYRSCAGAFRRFIWPLPSAIFLAALIASAAMAFAGAVFFRWGTVSFAFFVLSIAAIHISLVAAWVMHVRYPAAARLISLRGIASLAVVPIHYALLEMTGSLTLKAQNPLEAAMLVAGLISVSIWLSKAFAGLIRLWMSRSPGTFPARLLIAIIFFSVALIWAAQPHPLAMFAGVVAGQLGVAALLAMRRPLSNRASPEHTVPING